MTKRGLPNPERNETLLWLKEPENQGGNGAGVLVVGVTTHQGARESRAQGEGQQVFPS